MLSARLKRRQGGMILAMLVLVLAILLALAAFALDLGRLYVLRTEMQNAADAAALAAAYELDAESDAIERARTAAIGMLEHNSHFARVKELLGEGVTLDFTFYCSIGREGDVDELCTGGPAPDDANKLLVASDDNDSEAHYVRVTLDPELDNNADNYGISFYFIPVLGLFGSDTYNEATLTATAVAGRHFYQCNYPPVMLCDPFEEMGGMEANVGVGQQILLMEQGEPMAPGAFAFLDLDLVTGGGAGDLSESMAQEKDLGCNPPMVLTKTGVNAQMVIRGVNTRFDEYGLPPFNGPSPWIDYPPAPVIVEYFDDEPTPDADNRIGSGEWDRAGYFAKYHGGTLPPDWATITRAETYLWENEAGGFNLPDDSDPSTDELPDVTHTANSVVDRRIWHMAVLSCEALELHGSDTLPVVEPDGFAKLFITKKATDTPNLQIWTEFMGWASQSDQDYHVVVQLYE